MSFDIAVNAASIGPKATAPEAVPRLRQERWEEMRRLWFRDRVPIAPTAERALTRFETPPGQQSQLDWGTATVRFRAQPRVLHVFVLTLGFSRRSYYRCCPNETLPQFLDAHEHAFAYFGGHTREHLYD